MRNIKFKNIKLKNFKNHEESEISFEDNKLICIVGSNGAGKTSLVIDSMCFLLYDVTSKAERADDVIRIRSGKNMSLIGEFSINDDLYRIENYRKHHQYKNKKYLYKNDVDISGVSRKETNKKIEDLVMPFNVFCSTLLFSQLIDKPFLGMDHSDQKDIIDTILGLNVYDEYYKKIHEREKSIDEDISDIQKFLSVLKEKLEGKESYISDLQQRKEKENQEYNNYYKKYYEEKSQYTYLELINEGELEELKQQRDSIKESISKSKKYIEESKKEVERLIENYGLELKSEYNEEVLKIKEQSGEELKNLINKINELQNEFDRIDIEINSMCDSIQNEHSTNMLKLNNLYNESVNKLQNELERRKEDINNLEKNIEQLEKEKSKIVQEIDNNTNLLKQDIPTCGYCGQELKDAHFINNIESHIYALTIKSQEIDESIKMCEIRISDTYRLSTETEYKLSDNKKKYDQKKSTLDHKKKELLSNAKNKFNDQRNEIEENLKGLKDTFDTLTKEEESNIESLKSKYVNKLNEYRTEIRNTSVVQVQTLSDKVTSESSTLFNIENKINDIEEIIRKNERKNASLEVLMNSYKDITDKWQKSINEIDCKIEELGKECSDIIKQGKSKEKKYKELNSELEILKFWKVAMGDKGIKSVILDECIPLLNKTAKELCSFTDKIRVYFKSQTTTKGGELRDKFEIGVLQTKNLSGYSGLSAGELKLVNIIVLLCLRTLLETMSDSSINVLLLDEIMDSLDKENSQAVLEFIRNISKDKCVIFITHTLREMDYDEKIIL